MQAIYITPSVFTLVSYSTACIYKTSINRCTYCFHLHVDFSVFINEPATPVLGQDYTLFCNATRKTRGNITYRWKRGDADLHEMTSTLSLLAINISHKGVYSCIVNDNYTASKEVSILQSM